MSRGRAERDALARMRAALLDLMQAQRFTEANELAELIERIDPPSAMEGEAAPARAGGSAARPDPGAIVPPVASGPAPYGKRRTTLFRTAPLQPAAAPTELASTWMEGEGAPGVMCDNCGEPKPRHCVVHVLPCCPGSLMHGQDEGTWTPASPDVA